MELIDNRPLSSLFSRHYNFSSKGFCPKKILIFCEERWKGAEVLSKQRPGVSQLILFWPSLIGMTRGGGEREREREETGGSEGKLKRTRSRGGHERQNNHTLNVPALGVLSHFERQDIDSITVSGCYITSMYCFSIIIIKSWTLLWV